MESGIRENFTCEIRNPTSKWNPESKFQWQQIRIPYLESGIYSVESDPESKTVLDSVTWGDRVCLKKSINSVLLIPVTHAFWRPKFRITIKKTSNEKSLFARRTKKKYAYIYRLNTQIRLTMLRLLSGFELYSRWVASDPWPQCSAPQVKSTIALRPNSHKVNLPLAMLLSWMGRDINYLLLKIKYVLSDNTKMCLRA